jgi:hypothetical protein
MDTEMEGMLHLKVLHSPHAHARIVSIDKSVAQTVPGVHRVYTWEDVPRKRFTTAIHTDHLVDPDDTYVLDNVVRFVGQRVVGVPDAVRPLREEGCRRSSSNTSRSPPFSIPKRRWLTGRRSFTGPRTPSSAIRCATSCSSCTARSATRKRVSRKPT